MYSLLIVDDEPVIAEGLAEMVTGSGLPLREIKFSYYAPEALAMFTETPFDIVLADIRMPEMSGLEFFERIRHRSSTTKVIFLTGFSEFEYARKALQLDATDYLLKPADDEDVIASLMKAIAELEQQYERMMALESARRQVKEALPSVYHDFFRRLLNREEFGTVKKVAEAFSKFDLPFLADRPAATVICRLDEWTGRFAENDRALVQFAVQNMIHDMLNKNGRMASFHTDDGLWAMVIQPAGSDDGEEMIPLLHERLADTQETIYRVLGAVVSFALTPSFLSWEEWPGGFRYLASSLKFTLTPGVLLMPVTMAGSVAAIQYGYINDAISKVTDAIQSRDTELLEKVLGQVFMGGEPAERTSPESLGIIYMGISHYLVNLMLLYSLGQELTVPVTEKMSNFHAHKNRKEVISFLLDNYRKVAAKMDTVRKHPSESLIDQVKLYIHTHLSDDLSLDVLAKARYVSPSYLSRLFHQVTGEQLTAYITRVKMDAAKKLLSDAQYKIQDVAEKLGYQSPNYFSKVFRKTLGISPQDYRATSLSP
ncbi:response regulator transcription factor [Paenibacillus gansuensis]|uniref:Response regulator n=1 Tax=Paenibacillus gansuensis TaxID=306542 RepID=A0ABW5PBZ9_9BACL